MKLGSRIYIAGHRGLVGSALMRRLEAGGYTKLITRSHSELDLTNQGDVRRFFTDESPEYVFLAAAKVGGILANDMYPAEFVYENLAIQTNVIHEAWRAGVERLLFLGSSCIYPRDCPQPIREEYLLTGRLEPTNRAYAVAKIAGIEMCAAFNKQHGTKYLSVMPSNLYGPNDNYDLQNSHVLPALIRKFHEAKKNGEKTATAWGTGRPRREFMFSEDMADACIFLISLSEENFYPLCSQATPIINVGSGKDITIGELVELVKQVVGYKGAVVWDVNQPDGTPRKLLDVHKIAELGWRPKTELAQGVARIYENFLSTRAANQP